MSGISESVEQQDCRVMEKKDSGISLGIKFGGFGWGVGPEVGFYNKSGITWNENIHHMIAEYQELCSRYNTGRLAPSEYQRELDNIISRSRNYIKEVYERLRDKKINMFNEMDEFNQGALQ